MAGPACVGWAIHVVLQRRPAGKGSAAAPPQWQHESKPYDAGQQASQSSCCACRRWLQALAGERVVQLRSGWKHTLAVTDTGKFYSWGRNVNGQVSTGA